MERFGSGRYKYIYGATTSCKGATLLVATSDTPHADVTLSTGNEFCRQKKGDWDLTSHRPDFGQYWSDTRGTWNRTVSSMSQGALPGGYAYFPLGARYEFANVEEAEILPSSKRRFLFNFVGSLSTSRSRQEMIKSIERLNTTDNIPLLRRSFMHTPKKWKADPNGDNDYLNVDKYRSILLQSVLTLAPAGHNPECFRLYEALEAGSIPVVP